MSSSFQARFHLLIRFLRRIADSIAVRLKPEHPIHAIQLGEVHHRGKHALIRLPPLVIVGLKEALPSLRRRLRMFLSSLVSTVLTLGLLACATSALTEDSAKTANAVAPHRRTRFLAMATARAMQRLLEPPLMPPRRFRAGAWEAAQQPVKPALSVIPTRSPSRSASLPDGLEDCCSTARVSS